MADGDAEWTRRTSKLNKRRRRFASAVVVVVVEGGEVKER